MAVRNFLSRMKFWKRTIDADDPRKESLFSPEYQLANRLRRYEKYVSSVTSIIMWDSPVVSVMCVLAVNMFFWVFTRLEMRCYGIVSLLMLFLSAHDAWTGHIWPEISVGGSPTLPEAPANPSLVALSKIVTDYCSAAKQHLASLRNLRMQQPGVFCCLSSVVCSCLLLLGRSVSGLLIVYALLMALLLGPGLYKHCVPPELKQTFIQHYTCVQQTFAKYSSGDASDDEYLPVTTSEDIALLTRASDMQHNTYDSLTNPESLSEIAPGPMMPSHDEDSMGTLSDLEPAGGLMPLDHNDDSDGSNQGDPQIEFQSGHFNGDSSSDDSDVFSRDLVFSDDRDERDSAVMRGLSSYITQAVTSNLLGSVGLLANVIRSPLLPAADSRRAQTNRGTDSDSEAEDFEFISRDELNNQGSS